jgi:hypothetical protein
MTYILVIYMLLDGQMQTVKLKQPDQETCQRMATEAKALKANAGSTVLHAECSTKAKKMT